MGLLDLPGICERCMGRGTYDHSASKILPNGGRSTICYACDGAGVRKSGPLSKSDGFALKTWNTKVSPESRRQLRELGNKAPDRYVKAVKSIQRGRGQDVVVALDAWASENL